MGGGVELAESFKYTTPNCQRILERTFGAGKFQFLQGIGDLKHDPKGRGGHGRSPTSLEVEWFGSAGLLAEALEMRV